MFQHYPVLDSTFLNTHAGNVQRIPYETPVPPVRRISRVRVIPVLFLGLSGLMALSGCNEKSPSERAGEQVAEAMQEMQLRLSPGTAERGALETGKQEARLDGPGNGVR